jgi:hypothetical protein
MAEAACVYVLLLIASAVNGPRWCPRLRNMRARYILRTLLSKTSCPLAYDRGMSFSWPRTIFPLVVWIQSRCLFHALGSRIRTAEAFRPRGIHVPLLASDDDGLVRPLLIWGTLVLGYKLRALQPSLKMSSSGPVLCLSLSPCHVRHLCLVAIWQ